MEVHPRGDQEGQGGDSVAEAVLRTTARSARQRSPISACAEGGERKKTTTNDRYHKDTTWGDVEYQGLTAAYVISKIKGVWKYYTALSHGPLPYYGTCNEPTWRTTAQLLQDKTLHRYATPSGRYRIMSARGERFRWLPVTFATVNYEHAKAIVRSLTELEGKTDDLIRQMDSIAEMYG